MRKFRKLIYTVTISLALLVALTILASASDFDVSRSYFTSSGQSEAYFDSKSADSAITRGEAAQFIEDFVKKSAAQGIIATTNADKSFSDGGIYESALSTVYKYDVMLPSEGTKFGTTDHISYAEFLSAWLTILGYSRQAGDFTTEFPYECAGRAGIISSASADNLTFAQMLDVSIRALGASFNNKSTCLVSSDAYKNTISRISDCAKNSAFKASLDESVLLPIGNVCGDEAQDDRRFNVTVSRGNDSMALDTYKITAITASGYKSAGEISSGKRYTAFNFSGAITINVALRNDVSSFEIFSSSSEYSYAFNQGVLSVSVSKAQNIRIRFNGNTEQEIYIFALAIGTSLSGTTVKNTTVTANKAFDNVEFYYVGKVYINNHLVDIDSPAYFSAGHGTLVNAYDLCEYFGLDRQDYDLGREFYFNGIPYVAAEAVNNILGFDSCSIDRTTKSVKYVDLDYTIDFDELQFNSAADASVALSDDGNGNFKLSRKKSGFGGLIANVTEQYGLSGGYIELDFDAFASKNAQINAILVARGGGVTYTSATFNLSDSMRRCSKKLSISGLDTSKHSEIYLIISPESTSTGMEYSIAKHTITREEFYEQTQLVIYPEYPAQVNRIYDYKVTVTQGDRTEQLPVYNHTMWYALGNRTIGGDNYRRFSTFAFAGDPVRVDIKVSQDVESYSVMPSTYGLKSTFKDGVISVYLDKPEYFFVRLNNRDTTIISIFADYPEFHTDIPSKDDENVIWIEGWYEPTEDQHIVTNGTAIPATLAITKPDTILYIAPGAVLNARTSVANTATNTKVIGRGAIVDPYENIYKTDITLGGNEGSGYRPLASSASGLYVDGISILDSRSFHITLGGNDTMIKNVKEMSTMMTSDGISHYSGKNHRVEHCFMYVGDNAFVYSTNDIHVKNCIIGTTCAAFFPQGSSGNAIFEDCHVFASYGGLINNRYNGSETTPVADRKSQTHLNTFINLDAVDCVYLSWFFQGKNMGDKYKEFNFNGLSIPNCTGSGNIYTTSGGYEIKLENDTSSLYTENYTLNINNMYVDGKLITDRSQIDIQVTKTSSHKVASNTIICTADGEYKSISQHNVKVGYTLPDKVYVGSYLAKFKGEVARINGEIALPADEVASLLRTTKTPATVQYQGKSYVRASALVSSGAAKSATEENGSLYITPVYNGENLLLPDTGEISAYTEVSCWQLELLTQKDTDGDWIYVMQPNPKSTNVNAGIARFITDEIKMYGAGTYKMTFKAKASEDCTFRLAMLYDSETTAYTTFKVHSMDATTEWQDYEVNFEITEEIVQGEVITFKFYWSGAVTEYVAFTDITLTKK